jgi:hypothetical protein
MGGLEYISLSLYAADSDSFDMTANPARGIK